MQMGNFETLHKHIHMHGKMRVTCTCAAAGRLLPGTSFRVTTLAFCNNGRRSLSRSTFRAGVDLSALFEQVLVLLEQVLVDLAC